MAARLKTSSRLEIDRLPFGSSRSFQQRIEKPKMLIVLLDKNDDMREICGFSLFHLSVSAFFLNPSILIIIL
jgi:hypothetical protein